MYAKIASTTWDHESPTRSRLEGWGHEFNHEMNCAGYERMDRDCDCYVSRIRLVKTPVGEFIPTTEPDRRTIAKFWHEEAERLQRHNKILSICLFASAASGIATTFGLAFKLGLV